MLGYEHSFGYKDFEAGDLTLSATRESGSPPRAYSREPCLALITLLH
jgi:hypothetical protein